LAEIVEMQVGSLSRIERGKSAPSFATLSKLALALGVEVRDFFEIGDFAARDGRNDPLAEIVRLVAGAPVSVQRRALKTVRALISEE
jgi:transcriptional regulator with XRE-family HTH domain